MGQAQSVFYRRTLSSSAVSGRITKPPSRMERERRNRQKCKDAASKSSSQTVEEATGAVEMVSAVRFEDPQKLVGKLVQVYWECSNAWFDCDVIKYCAEGIEPGKHLVQYFDGIQEWRMLNEYRIVLDSHAEDATLR